MNLVHAAGETSPGDLSDGTHAVVLAVPDEAQLQMVAEHLSCRDDLAFKLICEPDPPYFGQLMAIGVYPGRKETLRRYLSQLPLLR